MDLAVTFADIEPLPKTFPQGENRERGHRATARPSLNSGSSLTSPVGAGKSCSRAKRPLSPLRSNAPPEVLRTFGEDLKSIADEL